MIIGIYWPTLSKSKFCGCTVPKLYTTNIPYISFFHKHALLSRYSFFGGLIWEMSKEHPPEPLDFFIWTVEDVGLWLEEINLGSYRQIFKENGVNGEYLEGMSMFTTEQILRFIRRCHMKWGDFITLCKELRRIKVACLKGEQKVRRPWWAPSCLSVLFVNVAKRNRQSRVVSLKLEP
ncbi:hypothetical protein CMV_004154 [Castanea mollissima]|uniref:SAM domain-containing protein n=2 Tax=Castanea TaxID=21019 RepID=A0A8J4W545_9ROSI|nr:hypothetical protein CMV_004154 [Castanea mollissima]